MTTTDAFGDAVNVTPDALRHYAAMLRGVADQHEQQASALQTAAIPAIRVKNLKTAARGLVALGAFVGAVATAITYTNMADGVKEIEYGSWSLRKALKRLQADTEAAEEGVALANNIKPVANKRESGQTTVRRNKK